MTEPTRLAKRTRSNSEVTQCTEFGLVHEELSGYSTDSLRLLPYTVAVAQSAERLVVVQEVAGSNPVSHPIRLFRQAAHSPYSQGSYLAFNGHGAA